MNIKLLINESSPIPQNPYEDKLNNLLLNQLFIAAFEHDDKKFNILVEKNLNFWIDFSFSPNYELEIQGSEGNLGGQAIPSTDDYSSFMHVACEYLDEKYIQKIVEKSFSSGLSYAPEPKDEFRFQQFFKNDLINKCVTYKKLEILQLFLNNGFFNETIIKENFYFYSYHRLKDHLNLNPQENCADIFKTWKSLIGNNIFSTVRSIETLKGISGLLDGMDFIENKEEAKQILFSLINFKSFYFPYRMDNRESLKKDLSVKEFISICLEHDIIGFHTQVQFTSNEFKIIENNDDISPMYHAPKQVTEFFNITPEEMENIYAKKLNRKLNWELSSKGQIKKIKI